MGVFEIVAMLAVVAFMALMWAKFHWPLALAFSMLGGTVFLLVLQAHGTVAVF